MTEEKVEKKEIVEQPAENVEEVEQQVVEAPVVEVPEECNHEGKLEAVSADVAELPSVVERYHNIFRCTSCGEIVVKDKK